MEANYFTIYWNISLNSLWRSKYFRYELKNFFCFHFLKMTFLKAVLGLQQNWKEDTEIFHIPTVPTINSFPHYQYPSPIVYLLQLMKLHWYTSSPPKFYIVYIRGTLLVFYILWVWTSVWHISTVIITIQSTFIALKILCVPLIHLSSTPTLGNHWFVYSPSFVFSRILSGWNQTVCSIFRWAFSLSNTHVTFLHVFSWLDSSFLFGA